MTGLLWVSLLLNLASFAVAAWLIRKRGGWVYVRSWLVARGLLRDALKERLEQAYRFTKAELYDQLPLGDDDVVFVGDSLTDNAPWHELLQDPRCKNRGIGGDTSAGVLARIGPIAEAQPAQLYLMVGVNDLLHRRPVAEVAANHRAIVEVVRARSPRTRLVVQGNLPINPAMLGEGDNARIRELNEALRALTADLAVPFLDLYPLFEREGRLDPAYTHDGLHLNARGYARWRDALATCRPRA